MWKVLTLKLSLIWFRVASAEDAPANVADEDTAAVDKFGTNLVTELRNDANLDLSEDEEYEDLRAELLAYHTALAKISESSRRSMFTTPCWQLGGICVNFKLCSGLRFLTEVPGCKDHHNVCCFTWNNYHVKDLRDHGIGARYPWSIQRTPGGLGFEDVEQSIEVTEKKTKKKGKKNRLQGIQDGENDGKSNAPEESENEETIDAPEKKVSPALRLKEKKRTANTSKKSKTLSRSKNLHKKRTGEQLKKKKKKKAESNTETIALILSA